MIQRIGTSDKEPILVSLKHIQTTFNLCLQKVTDIRLLCRARQVVQ